MMTDEILLSEKFFQDSLGAGKAQKISFDLHTKVNENQTLYNQDLRNGFKSPLIRGI